MTRPSPDTVEIHDEEFGTLSAPHGLASRTGDPIDTWLNLLASMLRLPPSRAREIRDELEDHLRTRVRDQLVEGVDEATAVRRAIEEVGEASAVAHRFRSAHRNPTRRILMHLSVIGVSACALALSIAAINATGSHAQPAVYEAAPSVDIQRLDDVKITTDPAWTFENFASMLGDASGMPVFIHWRSLDNVGISRDDTEWHFDIAIKDASFDTVMRLLNERIEVPDGVGVRADEGRLEFASREYLDSLTVKLVRYDLADVIEAISNDWGEDREDARNEIVELIQTHVHPDTWIDNGGTLASTHAVGDMLFIQAPARFFPKIEWLLDQLADGQRVAQQSADLAGDVAQDHSNADDAYQVRIGGTFTQGHTGRRYASPSASIGLERLSGLVGINIETVEYKANDGTSFIGVVTAPNKSVGEARIAALCAQGEASIKTLSPLATPDQDDPDLETTVRVALEYPVEIGSQLQSRIHENPGLSDVNVTAASDHAITISGPAARVADVANLIRTLEVYKPDLASQDVNADLDDNEFVLEGNVPEPGTYRLPADAYIRLADVFRIQSLQDLVVPLDRSDFKMTTHVQILRGNADERAVVEDLPYPEAWTSDFRILPGDHVVFEAPSPP